MANVYVSITLQNLLALVLRLSLQTLRNARKRSNRAAAISSQKRHVGKQPPKK